MRKKISKFLLMVLVPVVMFMTAGILSFSNISGAYSSARALSGNGGVAYVGANSTFNMTSGGISGSMATNGGAVYVAPNGTFNMSGGSIYGNIATNNGNNINNAGTFTMTGGTVGGKTIYTRVDENNKENALGDYILFGSYPKTIKADGITINENDVDDYGYYLGSDGARYAKVNATPRMNTYVYSDGTTIVKDVEYYFKVEPIKWRILSESNGEAILLAEDVLNANIPFYNTSSKRTINEETIYANNYEYSTIRAWLNSYNGTKYSVTDYSSFSAGDYQNNGFYNQAFSQREKDIILTSVVNNSKITTDSSSNPYESNNTNDKIWMLSYKDAINSIYGFGTSAFNYEKTRKKLATDYALANNVYLDDSNGYWKLRSPDTSYDVSWCVRGSGQIYGAYVTFTGAGVAPALKINLNASTYVNDDITSGYSIYNTGTMNLYGGNVYDSIYSSSNINTKMAANIAGTMHLADGATITIEDYAGTTPEYSIVLNSSRNAGTVVTFKGSTTKPDISKISVSGFGDDFEVALRKNSSGYWELFTTYFCLPTTWKTEIASTDYMTTTVKSTAITSVKFVFTAPTGYMKKGTLSTGLDVYLSSSSSTDIAFVSNKIIYAPENCYNLFYTMISVSSFEFTNFNTSHVTDMSSMFSLKNPSQNAITRAGERDDDVLNTKLTTLDLHSFDTSNVTDMSYMFAGCQAMKSVNLDGFDTSKVISMIYMFRFCSGLEVLDLRMFDTSSLIYIDSMFIDCSGLISLDLSSFNLSNALSYAGGMLDFGSTNKIETLKTPYNNAAEIRIRTGSTLYNAETGEVVTGIPANTTKSLTYVNQNPFSYFPRSWKTEVASTTHMTTTLTTTNLTSVKFAKSVPSGYTQVGTLSTGLPVYANAAGTEVAFVGIKILAPENSSFLFAGLTSVTSIDFTAFDTSNVINMSRMFNVCNELTALNIENFDTSKVTDMSYMFYKCQKITSLNLSNFNTTNVTNLSYMFEACKSLVDLNLYNFDTSNITDMTKMFYDCSSIVTLDLSNFNTANVTNMFQMFVGCTALKTLDLSSFDLSKLTNSAYYVLDFGSNNYIETLKTPYNNTSESHITTNSILYDIEKGEIVTSLPANTKKSLTYKNHLPFGNFSSSWKSEIVSTSYMTDTVVVDDLRSIKFVTSLPDGYTRIGTLSTKLAVFANADKTGIAFVADKIYAPANSYQLFKCGYITELDIGVLDTSKVTNMREMFYEVRAGEIDISGFDTSNVTTMNSMFHSCWNVKSLDFSNFNTSKVTDMALMFYNCIALTGIDLFSFDTSNVTIIGSMFYNCRALKTVNLKSFNTAKVTQMEKVFYGCLAIESLDLKNFDTSSVGYFNGMFGGCTLLKTIDLSSFDTSKAIRLGSMFYNCENIESLDLSHFVGTNLDSVHSLFKGMKSLKYLDISNMNLSKVTSYTDMLNFGVNNNIETLKTPYGCKYDLAITSGSKLYNVETGERVTTISANTASSMTLVNIIQSIDLPSDWQTQVASATYNMKEAVTVANLTSIKFVSTVPAGYTKIGELLNNLPVYANADKTAIAFVAGKKITAPADSTELFYGLTSVTSFDFEVFDTSSVTDMTRMFMNCNKLVDVDFATFNTENVTKMNYMFRSCSSLVTLDLSSFNTAKVQDMNSMFNVCGSLVSLNVSSFDTSKVNDMTSMFSSCSKLVNISLANFNTCNVSSMDSMFFSCSSLVNLDLSNFDTTNLHSVSYMFSYCAGLKTLDLSSFNLAKVSQYMGMLNFSENNHIETFKTPYGCKVALAITSGSTLYNESGVVVSTILANASASMTLSSTPSPVTFPTDWRAQLTGSTMTTTIVADDLTSIAFERSVPTGYTQIGTIATSILVYKSTSVDTDIVFVYAGKIKAPVDSSSLFKGLTKLVNLTFNNFDTSDTTNMYSMFTLAKNSSRGFTTNAVPEVEKYDTFNTTLENLDLSMFDTSKVVSMAEMFYGCVGLKTLDCSSFDMSNVANWTGMFNFTKNNTIKTLKLPYNNTGAIPITTGATLLDENGNTVTSVPANNKQGLLFNAPKGKIKITFQIETRPNNGEGMISLTDKNGNYLVSFTSPVSYWYEMGGEYVSKIMSYRQVGETIEVNAGTTWYDILNVYGLVCSDTSKAITNGSVYGSKWTTEQLKSIGQYWNQTEDNPTFNEDITLIFYCGHTCMSSDTEIDVYDEKRKKRIRKKLKDISYKDKLLVWNFDKGCFDLATPLFITKPQTTTRYTMVWFSDGSSLRLVGADDTRRHRVFCLETGKFEYVGNGAKVGMTTYNDKGEFVKITKIEFINEKIEFMNIITNEHFNCFANGILTSCKLSNMYPIKDMKYDKTNKTLNTRDMFGDISDFYYKALRLAEQPLLNTYNDHSEYIDYKQIYEIEWENSSFKRDEK